MRNSISLIPEIRMNRSRSLCSIFVLSTVCFTTTLYTPWVFSANDNTSQKSEWSVCIPFTKVANDRRQIPEDALERELAKFEAPEKEAVPKELAAYIHLSASTMNLKSMEGWQWRDIKNSVDLIYAGEITASKLLIDINNNDSLEQVVEFRAPAPLTRALNYVLNKGDVFHSDFLMRAGRPKAILGELRIFNGGTYVFDIANPVIDPVTGQPLKRSVNIYRPKTSAMMKDAGISEYGLHKSLCEFEIVNP